MEAVGSIWGGKYRVVAKLGEGGMGTVYHAENVVTGKQVALKRMHAHVASNPHYVERFVREARAAARLDHPNVLDIYDIVQDDGAPFLIMELLHGETLRDYLKRNPFLELPSFLGLILPAMDGVATAHEAGVIHRDLKPDNIFLARGTRGASPLPKVVDFGIARLLEFGERPLTQAGTTLGTPEYMSLEQLRGADRVDARTDVYAFGVMLYDALAGRLPHVARTLPELIIKLATTDPPRLSELRPDLPRALCELVDRAIARDREDRWPDLRSMHDALEPFAREERSRPAPRLGKVGSAAPREQSIAREPEQVIAREPEPADTFRPRELGAVRETVTRVAHIALFCVVVLVGIASALRIDLGRLVSRGVRVLTRDSGSVASQVKQLTTFAGTIHSPVCLVDADGDAMLDVVGSTGYANKGPAVILDGRTGEPLWSGGSYALGAMLFCPSTSQFVMNDEGSFVVTIRDARTPDAGRDVRLSDVPDRWNFGDDCIAIRTKDGAHYGLALSDGSAVPCDVEPRVFYELPAAAMTSSSSRPKRLTRGDESYRIDVRKPGTPVLTVSADGPRGWSTRLEYKHPSPLAVIAEGVLAIVGQPIDDPAPRLHIVGLDVRSGRVLYEQPLCERGLDVMSMHANGPNIVFMEAWTGVWTLDAKTGRVLWRSGSC